MNNLTKIKLWDYIDIITDYHSSWSYETLKEHTKILYSPSYAVMIRTLNFENNDFAKNLIYCDKESYDFLEGSHVKYNDVLMNKISNPWSVYIMPKVPYRVTCWMNLFLIRFKNINQRYIYYLMKYNENYIKSKTHWTTTKTITKDDVRGLCFFINNSKDEQDKIERLLTTIDEKIELNNKINSELEAMAKELYEYWFVQFDFPDENWRPYKSSGWKMVWSEELKRDIPEGWGVKKMLTVLDWVTNSQPPKSKFSYTKKEWYIRFIQNRDYGSDAYITYVPFSKSMSVCSDTDILIDKYGDAWRVRFGIEWVFNVALAMLKPHNENYLEYIRWYFETDWIYKYLHESCMASTRASLSEENLKHMYIVVPSEDIVKKYNAIVSKITRKRLQLNLENKKLSELRDFLLPMLMNGQVTVK